MQSQMKKILFFTILAFATLPQIVADIYVPSLPAIAKSFHSSASAIQLSVAAFMLGYAVSNLFYGPWSDRNGRKTPLLWGLFISLVGSFLCLSSFSPETLIFGRMIQGLGVGACSSIGRTVMRDLLSGNQLAKFGSKMGMISAFVLAIGPTLGGYIQHYFNWRFVFVFLLIYSALTICLVWFCLPETNQYKNPAATKLNIILKNIAILLKSKIFMGYTLCSMVAYSGLIAYMTSAPFLLQVVVGITPVQFGWFTFLSASSLALGSFFNNQMVNKYGIAKMISFGNVLMIIAGIIMWLISQMGIITTASIVIPAIGFSVGAGLTFANAFAGAFQPFPKIAGTVGAFYGCLQVLGASLTSTLVALLHESNQTPLALIFLGLGLLSLLSLKFLATKEVVE